MPQSDAQARLREIYGDLPLDSGPVDADNPTFDSLLGALEAVHGGAMGMDVLDAYHCGLTGQLQAMKSRVMASQFPEGSTDPRAAGVRMAMTVLDLTQAMLDSLAAYTDDPTPGAMASTLDLLLQCMGHMNTVNAILEQDGTSPRIL